MKTESTKVIFRTFPKREGGETIALFPQIAATRDPMECESYMHVGQHSAASVDIVNATRPATSEEIAPLKRELESLGYVLHIGKRITLADYLKRKAQIFGIRKS